LAVSDGVKYRPLTAKTGFKFPRERQQNKVFKLLLSTGFAVENIRKRKPRQLIILSRLHRTGTHNHAFDAGLMPRSTEPST
jgi:hypothetical protein